MKIISEPEFNNFKQVIQDAFKGPPWNEPNLEESEITTRLDMFLPKQRFVLGALVDPTYVPWSAQCETDLVGVTWFGLTRVGVLPKEVTHFLSDVAPGAPQIYYGATAVCRDWQGKKIARRLKERALSIIDQLYPGCITVTRMRSDNLRMIKINHSQGFEKCSIIELGHTEGVYEEWWFRLNPN
jgi:GNAT superfamily N-acetyltransferase